MSGESGQRRPWLTHVIVALVLAGAVAICEYNDWLRRWNWLLYDVLLQGDTQEPPDDLVIIAIDQQSLARLGRWPWSRRVHSDLLRILQAGQARIIVFDLLFAEPQTQDLGADRAFVASVKASGRVVLPVVGEQLAVSGYLAETLPFPELAQAAAALGHIDLELEVDGQARYVFLSGGIHTPSWPHLALAALQLAEPDVDWLARQRTTWPRVTHSGNRLAWTRDHRAGIPYIGPPRQFARVSYVDVLEGKIKPETFKDHIVLVGATATGLADGVPTPLSGHDELMPGVEAVANVFQGLRQGRMIRPLGLELQVFSSTVFVLLLGLLLSYLIDHRHRVLALALVAVPVLLSALLYGSVRLWFEPMSATLVLAVAFVFLQWRELRQVVSAFTGERMRAAVTLRTLAEAVITIDEDGAITYLNPAAEHLLGMSSAQAVGRDYDEVFRAVDEERGRVFRFREANADIDRLPNYWVLDAGDREQRTVRASFARLDDQRPGGRRLIVTITDVTQERHLTRQMHYQASHDPLTDLPNRMLLADRLEQAIARSARANSNLAVMFTDLDDFKKVNDSLGHVAGDALLRAVASGLNNAVRLEDTVGRLGGDEFVVLVEQLRDQAAAMTVAEKLAMAVRKPHKIGGQEVFVTTSIGVCFYPKDGRSADELLRNADTAMYSAKAGGGDAVAAFDQTMKQNAIERFTLEMDLQRALMQRELCLFYQPVIDLRTGGITGFEALIRWHHPRRGLLLPGRFIPMAEQSGLIVSIGEWVIRTACADLAAWLKDCGEDLRVAVNLSPRQLQDARLPVVVENALQETGLATGCLELEITEEVLMSDAYGGISTLNRLRDIGLKVAIDDFGTGYSSFSYLKRFSASRLKIDRSFVKDVTANADDAAIVEAIVAMAKLLRVEVTAEGVETLEQADFFRRLGCAEAQGLYFGKPLEANQVRRMLRRVRLGRGQIEAGASGDESKPQVLTDSQ